MNRARPSLRVPWILGCLASAACSAEYQGPPPNPAASSAVDPGGPNAERKFWEDKAGLLVQALADLPAGSSAEFGQSLQDQLAEARTHLESGPAESASDRIEVSRYALTDGDGCSVPGWADAALALLFNHWGGTFTSACQYHDRCYTSGLATYGLSRLNCDDRWYGKMKDRCDSLYPAWARALVPPVLALWTECRAAAATMYQAVRAFGGPSFWGTVCADGQRWPRSGQGPGCSSYEAFDSSLQLVCSGLDSGLHDDGHVGPSWAGCRGTGCHGCTEILVAYPHYFANHPSCAPNSTCNGFHFTCGAACPEPTAADL